MKRKVYWIGNHRFENDEMAEEISQILYDDDFVVELFGVDLYSEKLPKNYKIVDYQGRDTLAICENGEVITDKDEIERIEDIECIETDFDFDHKEAEAIYDFYDKYMKCQFKFYQINEDLIDGYLKINQARNGRQVIWFKDESKEVCAYMETLERLSKEEIEKELNELINDLGLEEK